MALTAEEKERVRQLFAKHDCNGDGVITAEEFKQVLGGGFTAEEVRDFLAEADINGDGLIDLNEYLAASE